MNDDIKLKGLDLHSEEVQELMGTIPSWFQRWGISLIAIIFIGVIILCGYIRIPKKIEINLNPLLSDNMTTISAPSNGRILSVYVGDNVSVMAGDSLIIYQQSSGDNLLITSPIEGRCYFTGPVLSKNYLPAHIELLQIHKNELISSIYYGYIPTPDRDIIQVGDSIKIDSRQIGKITFISLNPAANGQYYIEVSTPLNLSYDTVKASIIVSNESILKKIAKQIFIKS